MGAVLVVLGAADLWDAARTRPIGWTKAGLGIVFLITGPSIVLIPDVAFKTLTFLLAVLITIRGGTVLVGAVALSIFTARIVATWAPPAVPISSNSQVISPVSPRLLDMMIAVVAGAAGAYATVDKRVSSSITGVAIAVALVPPLAVVITGQGDLPPVSTLNDDLSDAFGVPTVATIEYFPSLQITEESQP